MRYEFNDVTVAPGTHHQFPQPADGARFHGKLYKAGPQGGFVDATEAKFEIMPGGPGQNPVRIVSTASVVVSGFGADE